MSYHRRQGDMKFVYKIIRGDNQSLRDLFTINEPKTRGISFKLYKPLVQTTIRKHFFSIRIMNNWNSLPYKVVNAVSLDSFHSNLDNAWEDKKYICALIKNCRIKQKILHTFRLVVFTISSRCVSFLGVSVILRVEKKEILQ